jgi:mRNA interferase MazF
MTCPKRGEVWVANLNPGKDTEPDITRPVLVVQSQALLDAEHSSTLVIPLTSAIIDDAWPLRIRIPAMDLLTAASDALVDQLRALDNRRFKEGPLLTIPPETLRAIDDAIRSVLDLDVG